MAAFEWLDFAIETDGYGSLRSPAAVKGLFSLRLFYRVTSMEGIILWGAEFDTFGKLARDAVILETINRVLYDFYFSDACTRKPRKILYPSDFWFDTYLEESIDFVRRFYCQV